MHSARTIRRLTAPSWTTIHTRPTDVQTDKGRLPLPRPPTTRRRALRIRTPSYRTIRDREGLLRLPGGVTILHAQEADEPRQKKIRRLPRIHSTRATAESNTAGT
eukprot:131589-Pyramimonas_sp.AAC.1